MSFLETYGIGAFLLLSFFFLVIGSRPILFHLICGILLCGFVFITGQKLEPKSLAEWTVYTIGLVLYWFGLTIVRIMLTRSVSLNMLNTFSGGEVSASPSEGIATRLQDAQNFGLISLSNEQCRLTPFGKLIAFIVATSYWILRIK